MDIKERRGDLIGAVILGIEMKNKSRVANLLTQMVENQSEQLTEYLKTVEGDHVLFVN